ncbi:L-type lectin-domain containing receptor kinase IX.1-like [Euphorbia lathyris]|uniref:L-type lectin-domain containing receptor kinase IX.1-like n=1 Tax=Euphorbia lathyris TaxID=212925 RepID=UPI0033137FA3
MAEISLYLHFLLLLLVVIAPFVKPFSFHKTRFELEDTSIIYEGGAYPSVGGIKLNSDTFQCQAGHATYAQKIKLWDSTTHELTNFSTRFSSIVDVQRREFNKYGSGFAFFLAPVDYRVPLNSAGGFLGLYNITTMNSSPGQIVHIEFDSVPDPGWDPLFQHVAININSLSSATYTPWYTSMHSGDATIVSITYDSSTMNLTVSWSYQLTGNSEEITSLSHRIDLREVLPEWVSIGFSGSTRDYLEDHTILSWDFSSSLDTDETSHNNNMHTKLLMLETIPPAGFLILVVIVAFSVLWTRKLMRAKAEKTNLENMKFDLEKGSGPRRISYADIDLATRNFSSENKLGKEGFGAMYKGYFPHLKISVAVKKIKCSSKEGKKDLIKEVEIISRLRHPNLVRLVGWCQEKDEFFLVYEFLPKGSLDSYLFGNMAPLAWDVRYKIATGLASALLYLHEEREQRVEHKDVKSSNIMLDSDSNVKLGDFGLAETAGWAEKFGHLPSEYGKNFRDSKGSDVHSFGLVALEISTGKRARDPIGPKSEMNVVEWVWKLYRDGKLWLAADKKLVEMGFDEKEMKCLLIVGIWCSHPDEDVRPSISQVIHVLNFDAVLPNLSTHCRRPQSTPSTSYRDGETLMSCSSLEEQAFL